MSFDGWDRRRRSSIWPAVRTTRLGHIPGAHFVLRSRFAEDLPRLPGSGPITLTSPDGATAAFAADAAAAAGARPVRLLAGGTAAWIAAGLPLERDPCHWLSPGDRRL